MPAAKHTPGDTPGDGELQVPEGFADVLFDKAYAVRESYEKLISERKANRESLRNLAAQGLLTDEQVEEMFELYPDRSRAEDSEKSEDAAKSKDTEKSDTAAVAA